MSIKSFEKSNLSGLRAQIQDALNGIAKENGLLGLRLGNISYSSSQFSVRLTGDVMPVGGVVKHTIDETLIGKSFDRKNTTYTITEIRKGETYPVIVKTDRGKGYKLKAEQFHEFSAKGLY